MHPFQRLGFYSIPLLLFPAAATANNEPLMLPGTTAPITIDGVLDDAAWQEATKISIDIETEPGENIPAAVETVAYIVENGDTLFVAFDASDPDPTEIRAYLQDRDAAWSDDFVGIVLDTYNDERRAFEFFVNPLGVQMDLTNDDVNKKEDSSWDAIWDSAGQINDKGFVVEMAIPLSQLRFPDIDGMQTWGFELLRFYPRDKRYRLSSNPKDRSVNCYLCQFRKIEGLTDAEPGRDVEIVPTITASRVKSTDDPGVAPLGSGDNDIEAGLSMRWGLGPDLTANMAINPDFSQVEADVAQLDVNNQFALFFPEKRPFFLEGADYFSTPMQAVFTRTVADPDAGIKLTGKRGLNTYGVFAARDATTNVLIPGPFGSDSETIEEENTAFVARFSRGFGDTSSVGALLTVRDGDSYHNYVGGFDARWKLNDQHSLQAQYLSSDTDYPAERAEEYEQPLDRFSGQALTAEYRYDSRNWSAHVEHRERSADFRADSGFMPRVDTNTQFVRMHRVWYGEDYDRWTRVRAQGKWHITHDDSGRMLTREIEAEVGIGGPMQSWIEAGVQKRDKLWENVLYALEEIDLHAQLTPTGGLKLGAHVRYGDDIDYSNSRQGKRLQLEPFVDWHIGRNLLLKLRSALVQLDTMDGDEIFDAEVHDVRLTWQFNRRSFLRLTMQLQDVKRNADLHVDEVDSRERDIGRQLLYSYKLNPQTVFFLGYSDNQLNDDDLGRFEDTDRTVFMKLGYAWTP